LQRALQDSAPRVRTTAMQALARIGQPAKSSIPALTEALKDADASVRLAAINALETMKVPVKDLAEPLAERLEDRSPAVRRAAARFLGSAAPAAVKTKFRKNLESPYAAVARDAAEFLWITTKKSDQAVPVLREAIRDDDRAVRQHALELLAEIA